MKKQTMTKLEKKKELMDKRLSDYKKNIEERERKQEEGSVIRTWGIGTGKTTMSLHVRKAYYQKLGWNIGDFVYMMPDYENKTLIIKKVDLTNLHKSND